MTMNDKTPLDIKAHERYRRFETNLVRRLFVRLIAPLARKPLSRQRIKISYFMWGYSPIMLLKPLTILDRIVMIGRFLRIDWNILHNISRFRRLAKMATARKRLRKSLSG